MPQGGVQNKTVPSLVSKDTSLRFLSFYYVFATPKIEFLLKVFKNTVKHMLLEHPPESARLASGPTSRHSPLTTPLVAKAKGSA